ncbi:MAG: MarR family winged helix-turn-helix transcriptional regulator [Anaerolineae bacterium]|jgi:MarR family transcriptional regulator, organic hydroperoxide resistance regulator
MSEQQEIESIGVLLSQICRLEHARAHELLDELGLYRGQHRILRALWAEDGLTHTELAGCSHVRPATISKTIQRMEKAGLVERRHDAEDQRLSRVYLTPAGRAAQEGVEQMWYRLEEEIFAGLPAEECARLQQAFLQIRDNLMRVTRRNQPAVTGHQGRRHKMKGREHEHA